MGRPFEHKNHVAAVTDKIIALLESGTRPWTQPWKSGGCLRPLRHNGSPYRGINVLVTWCEQHAHGYTSPYWLTFRQALEEGGAVRKGAKGIPVFYYGSASKGDASEQDREDGTDRYRFLRAYTVFNADQCEGLPERYTRPFSNRVYSHACDTELQSFFEATGAAVHTGGNRAFYRPSTDTIHLPPIEAFPDPECYWSTLAHETAHWTKHATRLDRQHSGEDHAYDREELVAELTAAYLGAELGLRPDHLEDHAAYIQCWLRDLRQDPRALFKAAAHAQRAFDYLLALQAPQALQAA